MTKVLLIILIMKKLIFWKWFDFFSYVQLRSLTGLFVTKRHFCSKFIRLYFNEIINEMYECIISENIRNWFAEFLVDKKIMDGVFNFDSQEGVNLKRGKLQEQWISWILFFLCRMGKKSRIQFINILIKTM